MKTFNEFIKEGKSFRTISSGTAANKIHTIKNKIANTNDLATKINLLAEMISVQSTLFFARDLLGGK